MTARPALAVENLHTTFLRRGEGISAVRGVGFTVEAGSTMTLLGESGSGKSVTVRSILRLHDDNTQISGSVEVDGTDVLALSAKQLSRFRGRRVALVPQDPTGALDPLRTVGAQLVEVLRWHGMVTGRRSARQRAIELFARVGIPEPAHAVDSYPHELSGGMRQRIMIAIAVSCEPAVLLADEPTTALDVTVQSQILELFADLQQEFRTALLMITHDVAVARDMGGTVGVMYAGRLVETGPARRVLHDPSHPYTRALLDCLPDPDIARGELRVIEGRPPLAGEIGAGCPFAPRCPQSHERCTEVEPAAFSLPDGRSSACVLHAPEELAWTS